MRPFENRTVFYLRALAMVYATTFAHVDGTTDERTFYDEMLKLHNAHRAAHGSDPLVLNKTMSRIAKDFATKKFRDGVEERGDNWDYGKNVLTYFVPRTSSILDVTADDVFTAWFCEGDDYEYDVEPTTDDADNFTQIVWKSTKELGLAKVEGPGRTLVVALYYPAGNEKGMYLENVINPASVKTEE